MDAVEQDKALGTGSNGQATTAVTASRPHRLVSLDAFRGLTIIGMLLVNNASMDTATPKHLVHAAWNQGINFADLVFPWFLFIVGAAIPYSRASQRRKGISPTNGIWKAIGRCVVLVLLGCLLDSSLAKRPIFDLGVLQIIGLAYLVGTILYELPAWARYTVAGLFLVGHWILLRFISYPGGEAGTILETQNIIKYINDTYLAGYNLKGLISVVPTAALVIAGTGAGDILRHSEMSGSRKTLWMFVMGIALCIFGWLWSLDIPFNKPLWTASYIIEAAGLGTLVLAAFYWVVDVKGISKPSFPLLVFGMNAIASYIAPILTKALILREWTVGLPDGSRLPLIDALLRLSTDAFGKVSGGWIYTGSYIAVWWLVMLYLYKKKIFFKV